MRLRLAASVALAANLCSAQRQAPDDDVRTAQTDSAIGLMCAIIVRSFGGRLTRVRCRATTEFQ
jgi:hypothetical protein